MGRFDARGGGSICESVRDHPIRYRLEGGGGAAQEGLRRRGEARVLGGGGASDVPGDRTSARRGQGLHVGARELHVDALKSFPAAGSMTAFDPKRSLGSLV